MLSFPSLPIFSGYCATGISGKAPPSPKSCTKLYYKQNSGTWNARSLYKSDALTRAAREFARYKLGLVDVTGKAHIFFYGKGNENHQLGTGFLYTKVSGVKTVQFVGDTMSYIVLKGHWCNTIDFNLHAPSEEKHDHSKDRFYEELEQAFDHFPKYHTKSPLGDFNAKLERGGIFTLTIGNESLHQDSNDNGVSIIKFAT